MLHSLHFSYLESLVIYYKQNKAKLKTNFVCVSVVQYSDYTILLRQFKIFLLPSQNLWGGGSTCKAVRNVKLNCVEAIVGRSS